MDSPPLKAGFVLPKIMNYAEEIKNRITAKELFIHYGFIPNKNGCICCPLHGEKTASLKIYDNGRGWCCFGCHKGGDIISFVREYFRLSFADAISKINNDFNLGLPIGQTIDRRKQMEMQRQAYLRNREQRKREQEEAELDEAYHAALDEWIRLDKQRREYAPTSLSDAFHPLFVDALINTDRAAYNLDCAEIARYNYDNRNREDSRIHG